ncbi:MAG: aminotransferase class V-fold PLP-dependent enzyme [Pseudomonadota bacterium]|nr:aminotransferase class V-fold PLP-dependent enzyme [Pseudomonadota bacterium]
MITYSEQTETAKLGLPIYLDNQSTTATDPQVLDIMLPFFNAKPGNPHSEGHQFGQEAMEAVETARIKVATIIAADPREIIFTSGATESNNLALKGVATFYGKRRKRIITTQTEHKCVIETCNRLQASGYEVIFLPVKKTGILDFETLEASVNEDTLIVSIMAAHNEIGVLQEVTAIGELCKKRGALFHTDAAQAVGKIPLDVKAMNVDLMSISGHKIYGPKGIGALYIRRRPRVRIEPLIDGGGQERGLRSGTLPTPLCVGLGEACAIAQSNLSHEPAKLLELRQRLYEGIISAIPTTLLHGHIQQRLPGNLNISFPGIDSGRIISAIPEIAFSSGSACTSNTIEPSYVIKALGAPDDTAQGAIRFGLGRFTTTNEIDYSIERITSVVRSLSAE